MNPAEQEWWRGAVIYQIYPRSFFDSNHDGIGDLPGITDKLDYVASLGVDAIWLSPFFQSPMRDFGYDVSDYRAVSPIFGSLDDFDRLIARAHRLNLRVLIDQVVSHTSDEHPWFAASRTSRDNPYADWYVWADPKLDGTPPNNWLSVFGGSAWEWCPTRMQFFLHNFLNTQPDLNFHNPAVVEQVLADMRFWLDRGVDGFRLDTANFYFHDALLRDNPPNPDSSTSPDVSNRANLYTRQLHIYDKSRPENIGFLKQIRALMEEYPGSMTVGEIGAVNSLELMAEYTSGGDKLHMAYSFDLLTDEFHLPNVVRVIEQLESRIGSGWPCWAMSNHDVCRVATRWGANRDPRFVRTCLALLMSLRGTLCVYQGEELGLTEASVPFERLQDPYGKRFWPAYKGRDGCRTPLPWQHDVAHGGFSTAEPWLPFDESHDAATVARQESDSGSMLNAFRKMARWRREHEVVRKGRFRFLEAEATGVLAIARADDHGELICAFNFSGEPLPFDCCTMLEPFAAIWTEDNGATWSSFF
jgi:alpha-glucosidase